MLLSIKIENFALIQSLQIDFEKGFNILCGETGSGKSILIDAINFVLGGKFNKSLIRNGEKKTIVEAVFSCDDCRIKDVLEQYSIEAEDMLIITRESYKYGKTLARVNNTALTLNQLRDITSKLLDIHGQHENISLLDNSYHIYYIDSFGEGKINKPLAQYRKKHAKVQEIDKKIFQLQGDESESQKKIEFIKYQIEDIDKGELKIGEDKELLEQFNVLANAEKLDKTLNECYFQLNGDSMEAAGIYVGLSSVIRSLRDIEEYSEKVKNIADDMEECYYRIEDIIHNISDVKNNVYYDQNELEYINERVYTIDNFKKKYGDTIENILNYREKLHKEYEELINSGAIIEKLKLEKNKILGHMREDGEKLHSIREKIGQELMEKIKQELDYVGLEKSVLQVDVSRSDKFNDRGIDNVQFLISTNPGEPLKPLGEIVSGGELSRIMLALKTVFFDKDNIPSVIFDEIDTGISGRIAQRVGEKMCQISKNHQVFCVTHLPQIASMSDTTYLVSKEVIDEKTYTRVKKLSLDEKVLEVAKMIGGSEVTDITIEHTKEMVKMADEKKKNIFY